MLVDSVGLSWIWWRLLASAPASLLAVFLGLLFATAYVGFDYYKVIAWPTANAVISSIEVKCVYAKRRIFRIAGPKYRRKYLDCDAKVEAEELVADGYRKDGTSSDIWVVYEPEAGRKTRAIVDLWPVDAGYAEVGRSVRVRYGPGRPDHVDYASELGHKGTVLGVMIIGLLGFACALLVHLPDFRRR